MSEAIAMGAAAPHASHASRFTPRIALTFPRFLALCIVHGAFAIWLPANSVFATVYAMATVGIGVASAARRPSSAAYWAVYIMGSEVLWRMTAANVLWEWGKYGAAATLLVAFRNTKLFSLVPTGAITYFLLLIPACAATIGAFPVHLARSNITFNLSGPLLLAIGITYFSTMPLSYLRPQRLLASLVLPIVGIAARVAYGTLTAENIVFEAEASFATSGGYGPNQVSTILGAATLGLVLLAVQNQHRWQRITLYSMAGAIFFEAALTFSRGGVVALLLGVAALLVHFVASPRRAAQYFIGLAAVGLVLTLYVLPRANDWTGGELEKRFTSVDSSGRRAIAEQDIQMFVDHPLLGVGAGLAPTHRPGRYFGFAAHTEFTRALAEHGVLGLLSLLILGTITVIAYLRAPGVGTRAWTAALVTWGFANMATASLRLAASAGLIALAFIDFSQLNPTESEAQP